jgi:hypothetical protein
VVRKVGVNIQPTSKQWLPQPRLTSRLLSGFLQRGPRGFLDRYFQAYNYTSGLFLYLPHPGDCTENILIPCFSTAQT